MTPPRRPAGPAAAGQVLEERYRLVRELGAGGMGSVWLAEDRWLERPVALKALGRFPGRPDELAQRRSRVLQEARALARLRHYAIVPVHDLLFVDGDPWIVMEYISGRPLDELIRDDGPLEERALVRIGRHVLRGLAAVHRAGIVHRDVKPANILVGHDGGVCLVDFGIAKISGDPSLTGQLIVGTLEYLAPERLFPGVKVGPPADIWALGVTFFYALEGYSPFRRTVHDSETTAEAIVHHMPKLKRSGRLADITLRMLAKDPGQRATLAEAYAALEALAAQKPRSVTQLPTTPARREYSGPADTPSPPRTTQPLRGHDAASGEVPDELLRVGPDTGAALLLAMDVRASVRVLANCPPRRRGELLQSIAAAQPETAATILRMLGAATAGSAFAYLQPQTAAVLLSDMSKPDATRILASTDLRAAARAIMELPPAHAAALLGDLHDEPRAAEMLTYATSQAAVAVVRADPVLGSRLLSFLPELLRTQARQAIADAT